MPSLFQSLKRVILGAALFVAISGQAPGPVTNVHVEAQLVASGATVRFTDPLGYTKPTAVSIIKPAVTNEWWVDMTSGSGTACTQNSPCGSITAASAKTGVSDGVGAYVHVKGTGNFDDPALKGSSGHEVVITTWADATPGCATECTATFTDNAGSSNGWSSTNKQWVIFDGGPDLKLRWVNSGTDQFAASISFGSTATVHHDIIFYRCLWQATNAGEWISSFGGWSNLKFINCEFQALGALDTGNQHHIYLSGCNGGVSLNGLRILNSILRDTPGETIEIRLVNNPTMNDVVIDGNAFHDAGKGTCTASWGCRTAITMTTGGACQFGTADGTFGSAFRISNNLIWDTGDGCLAPYSADPATLITGNTMFNWGSGPTNHGLYSSACISNFSFNTSITADIRNNTMYATGNDPGGTTKTPFPNNGNVDSFNACRTGVNCGTSSQANLSSASFMSLLESNPDFLKSAVGATTINNGTTVCATQTDYFGTPRPIGNCDIGAHER